MNTDGRDPVGSLPDGPTEPLMNIERDPSSDAREHDTRLREDADQTKLNGGRGPSK